LEVQLKNSPKPCKNITYIYLQAGVIINKLSRCKNNAGGRLYPPQTNGKCSKAF